MLSFSNFGSTPYLQSTKVADAVKIIKVNRPDLIIDGKIQAYTALIAERIQVDYSFSSLNASANVLIFPTLDAGNIAYKLLQRLTQATVIGPVLTGTKKHIHIIQRRDTVNEIINMTAIAIVDASNDR